MQKMRLLLIEDDEISREVLQLMLEESFSLTIALDLSEASKYLFDNDFDIVLLNVSDQQKDGLELCKTVAGESLTEPPFVIALGDANDDDAIRAFFKAGAYDYFVKPYNVVLFHESLLRLVSHIQTYKSLQESGKSAQCTVSIAMAQASYYGFAFDLMADISKATSKDSLANTLLFGLSRRGLQCAIQITSDEGEAFTYEEDFDVVGERTLAVFDLVKSEGRIFRFGQRLVFNDENVSLLVKSMDDTSPIAYDCVLDIGAKLIPCIQTKLLTIQEHELVEQLHDDMRDITQMLHDSLHEQVGTTKRLVENVTGQINTSIDKLELTEEQEHFFLNLVEKELQVESAEHSIQELEIMATRIYDKLIAIKAKAIEEEQTSNQSLDVELF